jgi:hypothetical protein
MTHSRLTIFFPLKLCILLILLVLGSLLNVKEVLALEPGTILYRTSSNGEMYGYSSEDLIIEKHGVMTNIYSGHAGIYIGEENGVHYVVEALSTGIVKTPAHYFVNEALGEELVAAKIPINASHWQRAKAVAIAKYLASADLAYDFDFSAQKGPWSGDWTCVGLTEKVYESANANNPERLTSLEYDPRYYAVDITPDGFDNISVYNDFGDVFSQQVEFSKIARRKSTILPAPEILGFNAGREYSGNRYIFLPYTQALQASLKSVPVDIELSSYFNDKAVRGKTNNIGLILKWSLVNNPVSSIKQVGNSLVALFDGTKDEDLVILSEVETPKQVPPKLVSGSLVVETNPAMIKNEAPVAVETEIKDDQEEKVNNNQPRAVAATNNPSSISDDVFNQLRPDLLVVKEQEEEQELVIEPKKDSANYDNDNKNETNNVNTASKTAKSNNSMALWSPLSSVLSQVVSNNSNSQTETENSNSQSNQATETITETTETVEEDELPLTLVISRLHTEGLDDWLEIWNYGEHDINLAEREIRLEKARTAHDPAIILRFEADSDAVFPGGLVIRAGEGYRVVRDKASADLIDAAHAIALRPGFTFADNGYTIYLAKGPVSSPDDEDIIDVLAYGEAMYYEGSGPAPALQSAYLLRRKASADTKLVDILNNGLQANWPPAYDSDDNARDFLLWPLGGELVVADPPPDDPPPDDPPPDDPPPGEDSPFTMMPGFDQANIYRLWSFSECQGTSTADMISKHDSNRLETTDFWEIGRWGCGQRLPYPFEGVWQNQLNPMLSGENFTILFSYKGEDDYAHPYLRLHNSVDEIGLSVDLFASVIEFHGFPGLEGRYDQSTGMDNTWRQVALVWNAKNSYWALYLDGEEKFFQNFNGLAPGFDIIQLGAIAGQVVVDDIALWQEALSGEEIAEIWSSGQPLNPQVTRTPPPSKMLRHFWNFDEVSGSIAHDSVDGLDWQLPAESIIYDGLSGKALNYPRHDGIYELNIPNLDKNNFSFSWWQQNNKELPYTGRLHLRMQNQDQFLAEFTVSNSQQRLNTGDWDYIWGEGDDVVANDNEWHHFALVYDDYHYRWQFFVDGELKLTDYRLPIMNSNVIDRLTFRSSVFDYRMDNFKIWQGALSPAQVLAEYNAEKVY